MIYKDLRPDSFDSVVGQDDVVSELKTILARVKKNGERLPDMLFSGPAGVGKSTVAACVARELFGDNWRERTIELNASDERGIQVVREKIKPLTKMRGNRIVLYEEADSSTEDAQESLRRIVETAEGTTFIFTCNYPHKIIDPIHSRCVEFEFKKLTEQDMKRALAQVLKAKNINPFSPNMKVDERQQVSEGLNILVKESHGDMRKCLTMLEKIILDNNTISPTQVVRVKQSDAVSQCLRLAYSGEFDKARELLEDSFILMKYNKDHLIEELSTAIGSEIADKETKARLYLELARRENDIRHGGTPILQAVGFLAFCYISPHLAKSVVVR